MTVETATRPAAPAVPVEPTTPIRPSEALRLGRLLRPRQTFGPTLDGLDGACAVGAAEVGGLDMFDWPVAFAVCPAGPRRRRHWLRWRDVPCYDSTLFGVTVHLNDDHYWPTERIAFWLEGQGF